MKTDATKMTRREALKTTLWFSSGLLAGGVPALSRGATPAPDVQEGGAHLLAFGDFGTNNPSQRAVADQMAAYTRKLNAPLNCVLALGDNFYGRLEPDHFRTRFSGYYPKSAFDCPFHALLGNHDYGPKYDSKQGRAKAEMELAHTRDHPTSRWKMPSRWRAFEIPSGGKPLVKVIYLDGNYFEGALTPQEKIDQRRWLETEMAKSTTAPWLWLVSHYPIFSETTKRGDASGARLLKEWEPYLRDKRVSLYLSGHDHNLQHLRVDGFPPDFVISGGGGASRYEVNAQPRGFALRTRGFNHIHVTTDLMTVRFIDPEGHQVHAFQRDRNGEMTVMKDA